MTIHALTPDDADAITDVLAEAFFDYPVMRFTLGDQAGYPARLRRLVGFFVAARVLRQEPLLGSRDDRGRLLGVAIMSWTATESPDAVARRRQEVFRDLGADALARYEQYGAAAARVAVAEPHWHLNMIGVRRHHAGRGLGRRLLQAVHRHAAAEPTPTGVSLTTELPANVPLYEHLGYRVIGQAPIAPGVGTWGMWRDPDPREA